MRNHHQKKNQTAAGNWQTVPCQTKAWMPRPAETHLTPPSNAKGTRPREPTAADTGSAPCPSPWRRVGSGRTAPAPVLAPSSPSSSRPGGSPPCRCRAPAGPCLGLPSSSSSSSRCSAQPPVSECGLGCREGSSNPKCPGEWEKAFPWPPVWANAFGPSKSCAS